MSEIYVIDTCAVISYFNESFIGSDISISQESLEIIDNAFSTKQIKLIFPSTVFIEIFKKWFKTDEDAARIKSQVFLKIYNMENMEIQPIDKEVLENFIAIKDIESNYNFDNHDKQILAAAMTMNCPLITSDTRIIRYNNRKRVVPAIFS